MYHLGKNKFIDYTQSGVNIDEGNRLVDEIKADCSSTLVKGTERVGGFIEFGEFSVSSRAFIRFLNFSTISKIPDWRLWRYC